MLMAFIVNDNDKRPGGGRWTRATRRSDEGLAGQDSNRVGRRSVSTKVILPGSSLYFDVDCGLFADHVTIRLF